ncbi:merozoite surface protein, putative [Perkinsus marinus ATCC 50983]|uniref:Merozoite surface protein, putative n=1 Tax=Perkinsus marinus (strain ATCC 50983 / TXsc) TaxID=423536 RepID=C5LJB7_PERM5|nr:merozoite surface protein, putative [Perkinsus marinus ATCC 50983]EER03176.1 merozoite surface protein, putative [Perkinsus marinus ATCC 50983]|eukprot:XP_002771360.1 merozoite surface protein, putative [Perkinsus marinus ATCC 50983]
MSLKAGHLAQMTKHNQGLLSVLEQLETSKRELEDAGSRRKEKIDRLRVVEKDFKSAEERANDGAREARAKLLALKDRLRSESDKANSKRMEVLNLEARMKVDIEALKQAVQVVKQKNLEYVTRCNRDDQKHLELKGERVKAQRELEELRKLGGSKQKELKGEQEGREEFGRSKAVLLKEIEQEESVLLSRKSALASAETSNEQLQQSLRMQERKIREAADRTYTLMDSLRAESVEYKKVEAEDTSQEKRVKNLEKTCQNLTAKINMEIASREAVEAEMK